MIHSMKALIWILLFKNVTAPSTGAGTKERQYVQQISKSLDETVLNKFIRLQDLEKYYQSYQLSTRVLNITDIVLQKATILERIFDEKENIVKRVAAEAEKLRDRTYPEDDGVLEEKLMFYSEIANDTVTLDPEKIPYHFSRCNCEENLKGLIKPSQCLQQLTDYSRNTHFGDEKVSFLNTSVHVPVDVYEGDQLVLRDIYLSDGIDDVVKQEVCATREFSHLTKWVYFTTETGVMRFYPDRVWRSSCRQTDTLYDSRNLYDSRTAPWYINSITSPKDVIILIDSSGSVKGPTHNALVSSVRELLKTLSPNDFMNMVFFNKDINNSCEGLFQATPRNKQLALKLLEEAEFQYEAVYEPAFQRVFSMLHSAFDHKSSITARCNPTVVLFTDGDSSLPTEAMAKWNHLKQFRVFSFAIGETTFPKEGTKKIACENRGFYDTIPFFEARQRARNYLRKLSEPMSVHLQKHPTWSLLYQDRLGLGEVMSVSVPVYHGNSYLNSSSGKNNASDLSRVIGVVGTDLSLEDLKKILYDDDMTNDYYPFLLDNNGFAIVHPLLRKNTHNDVSAVDFTELEGEKLMKVREDIVRGNSGSVSTEKGVFLDDRYYHESVYAYAFRPVKGTVFKVGVGVHTSKMKYIDSYRSLKKSLPPLSLQMLTNENDPGSASDAILYSSPCVASPAGGYNPCTMNKTEPSSCLECFAEGVLLKELDVADCDNTSNQYSNLLLHGYLSDEFSMGNWEASNSRVQDGDGALALFIAIDSPSFVRITYLNFSNQIGENYSQYDGIIKDDIKRMLADPRNNTYFRRAALKPNLTMYSYVRGSELTSTESFLTTASTQTTTGMGASAQTTSSFWNLNAKGSLGYILATKSVQVIENDEGLVPVVSGVVLDSDAFRRNLIELQWKEESSRQDIEMLCGSEKGVECLVTDDSGYLISSNQDRHNDKLGLFLGHIEGNLMKQLFELDVYRKFNLTDYQAYCSDASQDKSAGTRLSYAPSITDILSFGWWLSSNTRFFLYSVFRTIFMGLGSVLNIGRPQLLVSASGTEKDKMKFCVVSRSVVQFGHNGQSSIYGEYECQGGCKSEFFAVRDNKTNLLVIFLRLSEDVCYDACHSTPLHTLPPTVVTDKTMCRNDTIRYRKTLGHCYDTRDLDEAYDSPCSATLPLLPCYRHMYLFLTLFNLIMRHMG